MIDPDAAVGRRAWVPCASCADGSECTTCDADRSCDRHWRYLLDTEGPRVFLQCPACQHRWWHDTGFGRGQSLEGELLDRLRDVLDGPTDGHAA